MPSGKIETLATIHEDCQHALPVHVQPAVKDEYKFVMLGSGQVGKTAIVHHFLYGKMPDGYSATVEEFHQGEFEFNGASLTLDIVDTSGSYPFPAMRRLAIATADAFILVYAVNNAESFEEVRRLREQIYQLRSKAPIVVVGNKCDLPETSRRVRREVAETVVTIDWEHGFVEASAKNNINIAKIFQELLVQAKIPYELSERVMQNRRKSLPAFSTSPSGLKEKTLLKRNSCNVS